MPRKPTSPKRPYSKKRPAQDRAPRHERRPRKSGSATAAKGRPPHDKKAAALSFAALLKPLTPAPTTPQAPVILYSSPLAHLDYEDELAIKNKGLALFWQKHRLPGKPEPVISSPRRRRYRTTSKRRAFLKGSTLYLLFNDRALQYQKKPFVTSPLEPQGHGRIYEYLQKKISEPGFKLVAGHLNYLIVRGTYQEHAVIFNVDTLNGSLVRKLKIIADNLQKFYPKVTAAYIYPAADSEYYLEEQQPTNLLQFKKLYGKAELAASHHQCRYFYHPTSFSQVNESLVPKMLETAKEMLAPQAGQNLLDLYCGYGLFSHYLAPSYKQVLGIDIEGPSIRAAISNKKFNPGSRNARFLARRITERSTEEIPPPTSRAEESILLDPPRLGPQKGVIATLALREPAKVLHIHCGIDQIPASIEQWQLCGYGVERIVPLDMFPGSANLEVLILFSADQDKKDEVASDR